MGLQSRVMGVSGSFAGKSTGRTINPTSTPTSWGFVFCSSITWSIAKMRFYGLYLQYFALSSPVNFGTCRAIFPLGFEVELDSLLTLTSVIQYLVMRTKEEKQELKRQWYLRNRDRLLIKFRDRYRESSPEQKAKKLASSAQWRKENPEVYRACVKKYEEAHRVDRAARHRVTWRKSVIVRAISRDRHRAKNGWPIERFEEALYAQDYKCAICSIQFTGEDKIHPDNCHATGNGRSLLCHQCNLKLGMFENNRELFEIKFPAYLKKWGDA